MSATRLYLIRHGEVESSYHQVFGGRIDMNLSPRGQEQAASLAAYFHRWTLQALYASPMKRARQTLQPLAEATGISPSFLDGLREVDFGDWTGLTWREVQTQFQASAFAWLELLDQARIPHAESTLDWRFRVAKCLKLILEHHQGHSVGVVCHGGVIRMMLSILLEMPLVKTSAFEVEYASITSVHHRPDRARIHLLNFAPWRDGL